MGGERLSYLLSLALTLLMVLLPLTDQGGADYLGVRIGLIALPALAALTLILERRATPALAAASLLVLASLLGLVRSLFQPDPSGTARALVYVSAALTAAALAQLAYRYRPLVLFFLRGMALGVLLVGGIALYLMQVAPPPDGRAGGTFVLPNLLAGYLDLMLFVPLAGALFEERLRLTSGLLYGGSLLVGLAALMATGSRAGWAAFGMGAVLFLVLAVRLGGRARLPALRRNLLLTGTAAILSLLAALLMPGLRGVVAERAARLFSALDYSLMGRLNFWQAALDLTASHPLTGIGVDYFRYFYPQVQPTWVYYATDPHSGLLNLLVSLGLPLGLMVLAAVVLSLALALTRLASPWRAALAAGLIASLLHMNFDFDLTSPAIAVGFGAVLGVMLGTREEAGRRAGRLGEGAVALARYLGGAAVLFSVYFGVGWQASTRSYDQFRALRFALSQESPPPQAVKERERLGELIAAAYRAAPRRHAVLTDLVAYLLDRPAGEAERLGLPPLDRLVADMVATMPRDARARYLRGRYLAERRGDLAGAERELREALRLAPRDYPIHYFYLARLLRNQGKEEDALRVERELLRNIPLTEPMTPSGVRPTWTPLNPLFRRAWKNLRKAAREGRVELSPAELEALARF